MTTRGAETAIDFVRVLSRNRLQMTDQTRIDSSNFTTFATRQEYHYAFTVFYADVTGSELDLV